MPDAAPSRNRPLQNRRVAVTRPEDGASGLADRLRDHGAIVVEAPLLRIAPPSDPGPLNRAAADLPRYDWVVFTSANAVRALRAALGPSEVRRVSAPHVAVVGPATARAVHHELSWAVTAVPERFTGAALAAAMAKASGSLAGRRVLWPRAAGARDVLRHDLISAGALLDAPEAYRTVQDAAAAGELGRRVANGEIDIITFTSPSAVQCYAGAGGDTRGVRVAVIGPTTAAAVRVAGFAVHVQPTEHTLTALVEALAQHLLTER